MAKQMRIRKSLHQIFGRLRNFLGPAIISAIFVAVFLSSCFKYRYGPQYYYLNAILGDSLCWSRGAASVLYVSCCLVLLPMCRNVLALIRNSNKVVGDVFGRLMDRNIWFHKACALVIVISTVIHTGAHLVNFRRFSTNYSLDFTDLNFASNPNQGPLELLFTSVAGLTGMLMILLLLAMIITSTAAVRRTSYETFWYTHHLFIVFFLLLFVHGLGGIVKHQINLDTHPPGCEMPRNGTNRPNASHVVWCLEDPQFQADKPEAWIWCIGPLLIYITERLIRAFRGFQRVELIQAVQHGGRVVEIKMKKPNFTATPGQYVFIRCADVSRFEWHPFTLTKCPSSEDSSFSIHFKILGDWTEKFLNRLFLSKLEENDITLAFEKHNEEYTSFVRPSIKISVDGPYGSPCMDIWRYEVSLCIATGIGITPFAALFHELRHKIQAREGLKLHRLYFVWVCKHIDSFQWFVDLSHSIHAELWGKNQPDFLICNFYVTGPQSEDQISMKQHHEWLASRLHQHRPSWRTVFDRVSRENPRTKVGVFYCGSRKVTPVLKNTSRRFYPTRTKFIFNKEILA